MKPEQAFGAVLKALREERELSQEALALEAGLERNYVSLLERGINSATIKTLYKIAKPLGIEPSAMLAEVEKLLRSKGGKPRRPA